MQDIYTTYENIVLPRRFWICWLMWIELWLPRYLPCGSFLVMTFEINHIIYIPITHYKQDQ